MTTTPPPEDPGDQCREYLKLYLSRNSVESRRGYDYWFSRIKRYVSSFARSLSPEELEDVVVNVLFKIYQNGHAQNGHCGGWVKAIARNTCIDVLRNTEPRMDDGSDIDNLEDYATDPNAARDEHDCMEKVFTRLAQQQEGPDDIEILRGIVLGESHEEIAERIGRSSGAVATRITGLRKKLRQLREELC